MHDALVGLLDKVDTAVAESMGVLHRPDVDVVARLARDIRIRLSYPESVVVVAFAGGTGSGKSSLFNAVAGEEVALSGGIRPMTAKPLASLPAAQAGSLAGYMDALGVTERVEHDGPSWLCLLDLPDNDSVQLDHRHQVDALLPRVDLVVWVTDPEKYRDARLHHGYIAPLATYQDQFIFVLNQVDRLDPADALAVEEDFGEALREDGIAEPLVIATAAQPVAGPPIGIDRLVDRLEVARDGRRAVYGKSLTDLAMAAFRLVESSSGARGVDFETRWAAAVASAVGLALEGRAAGGAHDLASFISELAVEIDGESGERLQAMVVEAHASFLACVARSAEQMGPPPARRRFWRSRFVEAPGTAEGEAVPEAREEELVARVDRVIGDPVRQVLVQRGRAHAAVTELALALGDLERKST